MGETVTKVLVDENFLVMIRDGGKFTCQSKSTSFNKRATKLSSLELTMVKQKNNQSASKEEKERLFW
jgi:hypothetical protein